MTREFRDNYGGFGSEWQRSIYLRGLTGEKPEVPVKIEVLEEAARVKLSPEAFDYAAGGAGSEETIKANLDAFKRWRIIARMLTKVEDRDTRVKLFGQSLPAPLLLAPVGVLSIIRPDGELAVARASAALGIPFTLSTASSHSIEEVAEVMGNATRWYQLYYGRDREVNASLVSRAEASGYKAIVVTIDTKLLGWRERDLQRGYLPFLRGEGMANYLTDPVFRSKLERPPEDDPEAAIASGVSMAFDQSFSWDDLKRLKDWTRLPVLLKGILRSEDAKRALDAGADGIVVSNHGGRQLDGSTSSLAALPAVVKEVDGRVPVLLDSGIRRGSDALKAIALGAKAVLLGRPYVWGLAVKGEEGVSQVLQNFLADFDISLALCGLRSIEEVGRDLLVAD